MLLQGKLALVTGAGQGNGAAIARGLAHHGAEVVICDINAATACQVASEIRESGRRAWSFHVDVADAEACRAMAAEVEGAAGRLSILVNNAGICPRNRVEDPGARMAWDSAMRVNLDGTLNMVLPFLPALRATKGVIINMASIAAFVSTATSVAYSTSKAAIKMLTQNLAQELAKDGVRVNAVAPGTIETAMTEATRFDPQRSARFLARIPMGRYGRPEELIGPVVFLASDLSTYVTGTTVVVDGGYLAI